MVTRPDLDAIRARASGTAASPHRQGRRDVPRNEDALTLLAYIDELERLNGVNNRIIVGLLSTIESMSTVDASYDDDEP